MTEKTLAADIEIANKRGLHARASAKFVKMAESFDASFLVKKDNNEVCGTSIMGLMLLVASKGDSIRIEANGAEAEAGLKALTELIHNKFGEED